jgi:hypothetical protein
MRSTESQINIYGSGTLIFIFVRTSLGIICKKSGRSSFLTYILAMLSVGLDSQLWNKLYNILILLRQIRKRNFSRKKVNNTRFISVQPALVKM